MPVTHMRNVLKNMNLSLNGWMPCPQDHVLIEEAFMMKHAVQGTIPDPKHIDKHLHLFDQSFKSIYSKVLTLFIKALLLLMHPDAGLRHGIPCRICLQTELTIVTNLSFCCSVKATSHGRCCKAADSCSITCCLWPSLHRKHMANQ